MPFPDHREEPLCEIVGRLDSWHLANEGEHLSFLLIEALGIAKQQPREMSRRLQRLNNDRSIFSLCCSFRNHLFWQKNASLFCLDSV